MLQLYIFVKIHYKVIIYEDINYYFDWAVTSHSGVHTHKNIISFALKLDGIWSCWEFFFWLWAKLNCHYTTIFHCLSVVWHVSKAWQKAPDHKASDDKSPRHRYFSFRTLFFQNQVGIFPSMLLQISILLRSRCDSNLKRSGSREVLIGISESG